MFYELKLFLSDMKDVLIYPDMARKMVAEACDEMPVDPEIFARDSLGRTLNAWYGRSTSERNPTLFPRRVGIPPLVAFDGSKGMVRLYGYGKTGAAILQKNAPLIMTALSRHTKSACRIEENVGDFKLKLGQPEIFMIRRLVMAKKRTGYDRFNGTTAVDRADDVRNAIYDGILSQAYFIDEQGGMQNDEFLIGHIPKLESMRIEVFEGESIGQEIKPGINASAYKNVVFAANLELAGPWMAGKMRSRGNGFIRKRMSHD